jgi:hypothetical protein
MTFGDRRRAPGSLRLTMGVYAEVPYSRDIPAMSIKQVPWSKGITTMKTNDIIHVKLFTPDSPEDILPQYSPSHDRQHVDKKPPSRPSPHGYQTRLAITLSCPYKTRSRNSSIFLAP